MKFFFARSKTLSLPDGTITFLLTDVEGSAKLWERAPDAMSLALARHDEIAAAIAERHHGTLIKSRGEGDSLFFVFDSPVSAISAAVALQLALFKEIWPGETPLRVRMALHLGGAELRDNDYYGPTVNRCARLRSLGQGGQILLSEAICRAADDFLPENIALDDLGSHSLKDLSPEHVWMVLHPGLPVNRSLKPQYHNLPIQLTAFIGRQREIADMKQRMETSRLLTITGAGGSGKTRLTLQVAADRPEIEWDGVWLVELAPLTDPALVPHAVAAVLKVREEPGRPLLHTLTDALKSRSLLLILDNCEHLLAACAELADALLRACPNARIVASSREALGIAGETIYRLPSLGLPEPSKFLMPQILMGFDSVRLFLDRAVAVAPQFALTSSNGPAVAQVCRRLDGIPLAIELAAARVRVMPIEQIAHRLNDRFRLLTGGSRTALPRQQTLRALIDWSYDLLTPQEKMLLRRLSVFAGGWTLEAAEEICAGIEDAGIGGRGSGVGEQKTEDAESIQNPKSKTQNPPIEVWETLDLLTSLADKSLVLYEESEGKSRYRLLETVRQYSADRLFEGAEREIFRAKHGTHFLNLAERAVRLLTGPEQAEWLERLETEHDNLRVAQETFRERADGGEAGLRIVGALWRFWMIRGHLSEGKANLDAALARDFAPTELRANALNGAAILSSEVGDLAVAQNLMEEALRIREGLADAPKIAITRSNLGIQAMQRGDYETAKRQFLMALPIFRELNHTQGVAAALNNLGHLAHILRDFDTARQWYDESLALSRKVGDEAVTAVNLQLLGVVTREQGDFATARRLIAEGLKIRQTLGDLRGLADSMRYFAELAAVEGDGERAAVLFGAAEQLRESIGATLPPAESGEQNRYVSRALDALDKEAFSSAWERGRAVGMEAALQFALERAGE